MSGETVKVIVRCRPMNKREKDLNSENVVTMSKNVTCGIINPNESNNIPKNFTFDGAYGIDSTTEAIYNDVGFALVESVLEGYNGTVFAYGQTGCGKSFTMQGVTDPPCQSGIIPRSFEHIFEVIQTSEDMKFLVHASYLEIYNEEIRDLLGSDTKKKLDLKEHPEKGVYINGLTQHPVHNTAECESLMEQGWAHRSTGATLMNADSSRSHSIFRINLEMMSTATGDSDAIRSGKLNLVDLAGSERQAKTGATGDRLKEATKINLSLSALGNVISALVDSKSKHIPYRDSKLTRLLQDSLGGNTKTLMVACLSPADNNYDETLSTLRYANRAKNIKNKPKINEDPKDAMLREYQEEIHKLRDMLEKKGPQETVVSVAPDEKALEEEREKVRVEYEYEMVQMKEDMEAERENNAQLQANMEELRKKYEEELQMVNAKIEAEKQQQQNRRQSLAPTSSRMPPTTTGKNRHESVVGIDAFDEDGALIYDAADAGGGGGRNMTTSPMVGVSTQNAEMMTSMQEEALKRLKELQQNVVVGGEKAQDKELKAKRVKRKKYIEKRKKILSEALKNVDDEDGIMLKVYDDIHEELKAKTDLAKKQKQKIKSMEKEVRDLTEEFQSERSDFLETIRKQDQQIKLVQAILERVQPTIRRDCNYSDLDSIKKDATWDDEYMRWKVPDLTVVKTKLPPAGANNTLAQSDLLSRYNHYNKNTNNNNNNNNNTDMKNKQVSERLMQAGIRNPSQTAPARLGMWDDEDNGEKMLKKLQRGEAEDIVGSYFKPKRAKELLGKSLPDRPKKTSTTGPNLNMTMSQSMLHNTLNLNSSFNNSQGSSSYSSSWGSNASNGGGGGGGGGYQNMNSTFGGSGGALNNMGNVMSNGWLGDSSSSPPEGNSLRRPNRLEALPSLDGRGKKKSRDVLHTLDLI